MSVLADFSLAAEGFALGEILEVRHGIEIRLESMVPTGDAVIPYFWVETQDAAAVESALAESPLTTDVRVLDEAHGETLFRVSWSQDIDGLIDVLGDVDAVILEGRGHGDTWSFRGRFPEYTDLSTFYRDAVDQGVAIDLEGVHSPVDPPSSTRYDLTDQQREALLTALEKGYFEVPREITLVEIAEELGISDSAVSQRLRRGLTNVLSRALVRGTTDRTPRGD